MHCLIFIQLIISSFPRISLFLNWFNLGFSFFLSLYLFVCLPYPCSCSFISLSTVLPPSTHFGQKISHFAGVRVRWAGGYIGTDSSISLFKWEKHEILLLFPTVILFLDFPAELMFLLPCPCFKNKTSILLIQKVFDFLCHENQTFRIRFYLTILFI